MTRHGSRVLPRAAAAVAMPLALALMLTGCPPADGPPPGEPPSGELPAPAPESPAEPPPDDVALEQACTNEEYGFRVRYPAGWVTNERDGLPPCSAFDPSDVGMRAAAEIPRSIAIVIRRDRVRFGTVVDFDADPTVRVLSREETTVAGQRAVTAELEHTGTGMYPAGDRQYSYYVEVEPNTVIATTHGIAAADPPPYHERRRILQRMVASISWQDPR
jgi:hypothetical protein